ncbi:SpoIIE family protein phosphatase [Methanospirillum hungatei]|jgi:serine phosphatase RsbU (regulator of sigma subunit)|uniref:SpoIIE family protein phosphatase n=1 Tax=Methanospirillum hungatei TaxID=2203 RepID=UPI0009CDCFC3|nr:SpoIIE family protein phosphatase [Methanospirillum hungatei]MBP9008673.1 SpoIIE family protein phosphatase [Methanospirillum sp.]OQA59995.1 MAG: hybrid sensory histidine kinase BarA [Euryarchaeota archaeon ADurb.Bin294]HOW04238.1 SpoIIE family protein phosphatase [Methanospirillum hungatei]
MIVSIRQYLIFYIILIISLVLAGVLPISYIRATEDVIREHAIIEAYTEHTLIESVQLVNKGLDLIDSSLNPVMEEMLSTYLEEYTRSGQDPGAMDLFSLKERFSQQTNATVDLYVFNEDGIILYTTEPAVKGVDFKNYPEFYSALKQHMKGSTPAMDRVVRSVQNQSDLKVLGDLRKFAYIPTPDHRYVLEIGLLSDAFADIRSEFSYQYMVGRIWDENPDIDVLEIYDIWGNRVAVWSSDQNISEEVLPLPSDDITQALRSRSGTSFGSPVQGDRTTILFIDLKNPQALSDDSIVAVIRYGDRLKEQLEMLLFQYILFGIVGIGSGIILALLVSKRISAPIREIVTDVHQIADGDLDHTIRSMHTLEFTELETSMNLMIQKIKEYSEEIERKRSEMLVASKIQQSIIPASFPVPEGFDIAAITIPALEVGGDFYDIFSRHDTSVTLVLADVAGKGVPAALFMALSRTIIRILTRWPGSPAGIIRSSNSIFIEDSGSVSFVTLFFGVLDAQSCILRYVNAGHNPPVLYRAERNLSTLEPTGPVIGLLDDPDYSEGSVTLSPGDVLVIYSDGVTEAMDPDGKLFTEERLYEVIQQHHLSSAEGLMQAIVLAVRTFAGTAPQSDDLTLIVVKR